MRVAVTGTSGLIGSEVVVTARAAGHEVVRLVRRGPSAPDEVRWDPAAGTVDLDGLAGVDAVVHLAGAGVADHRWTADYKARILDSRVQGTTTISQAVAALSPRPAVLLSGSAIGWYGDTGGRPVDEGAAPGDGFLAEVCRKWEASTAVAEDAGVRVAHLRTGIVLSSHGGALGRLLPLLRLGLGGRIGRGRAWWSWLTLADQVRAILFLLDADVSGPVNLTGPTPATNAEVTAALAAALHRPALAAVPPLALRLVLGELADDVLASQRVLPARLAESGFSWMHPELSAAAQAVAAGRV